MFNSEEKKAIGFVVDGVDANVTRDSLEAEIFKNFEMDSQY